MMPLLRPSSPARPACPLRAALALSCALALLPWQSVRAADPVETAASRKAPPAQAGVKELGEQVREALGSGDASKKRLTLNVGGKEKSLVLPPPREVAMPAHKVAEPPAAAAAPAAVAAKPQASQQYIRARAAALAGHQAGAHGQAASWSYEGETGPQAWGRLKPEFNTCAMGRRQSPIHIEASTTLRGPAEAIQFSYQPSQGTVVNNGHTIQVDVHGENSIAVRGSTYRLLQFHFHHPSEERIDDKIFSMVAHLVHRNEQGQLAVVGVLLDPGTANSLIHKVWTYMPLDKGDSVRMPAGLLDLAELLPKDQRYYQFLGSLTTPPCTEGVLWLVLKQPVTLSGEQLRLFGQLFPNNARPVQPVNGRPVRDAQ